MDFNDLKLSCKDKRKREKERERGRGMTKEDVTWYFIGN